MTIFAVMFCMNLSAAASRCYLYPSDSDPVFYRTADDCNAKVDAARKVVAQGWMAQKPDTYLRVGCVKRAVNTWEPVQ